MQSNETHAQEPAPENHENAPIYVLRGGTYLLDEHAGVLIDSAGNYSAKTRGDARVLAFLLRAVADDIEDEQDSHSRQVQLMGNQCLVCFEWFLKERAMMPNMEKADSCRRHAYSELLESAEDALRALSTADFNDVRVEGWVDAFDMFLHAARRRTEQDEPQKNGPEDGRGCDAG